MSGFLVGKITTLQQGSKGSVVCYTGRKRVGRVGGELVWPLDWVDKKCLCYKQKEPAHLLLGNGLGVGPLKSKKTSVNIITNHIQAWGDEVGGKSLLSEQGTIKR